MNDRPTSAAPAAAPPPAAAVALMARRFRGYLPVAIDVECGGFHAATDALLEIAAVLIDMDADGTLKRGVTHNFHVKPFEGARLDPAALRSRASIRSTRCDRRCPSATRCSASSARSATRCAPIIAGARSWSATMPRST